MPKPSVGRIVHYVSYGTPGGEFVQECRAAIVTAVPDEQKPDGTFVQLCVLNPSGWYFNGAPEDQSGASGGSWHWPEPVVEDDVTTLPGAFLDELEAEPDEPNERVRAAAQRLHTIVDSKM